MIFPTSFLGRSQRNFRTLWSPLFGCYKFDRLPKALELIVRRLGIMEICTFISRVAGISTVTGPPSIEMGNFNSIIGG
jgi:hypothetical protein